MESGGSFGIRPTPGGANLHLFLDKFRSQSLAERIEVYSLFQQFASTL
jgi:hypothetical protein